MAFKDFDKEDEKILRAYCEKLPVIYEVHSEVHRMKGSELIEMNYEMKDNVPIDPELYYNESFPVKVAVNHYRRLKLAWLKDKEAGIDKYIKDVAKVMEANGVLKENNTTMVPEGEEKKLHNLTVTEFGFMDRIRILFGRKVRIYTEITCSEKPFLVTSSTSTATVDKIFNKRRKTSISPNDQSNHA